jgi:predicted aspartyl protease
METVKELKWPLYVTSELGLENFRRFGPAIRAAFQNPDRPTSEGSMPGLLLIDSGTTGVLIDTSVAEQLGLKVRDTTSMFIGSAIQLTTEIKTQMCAVTLLIHAVDADSVRITAAIPVDAVRVQSPITGETMEAFGNFKGGKIIGRIGRNFLQFAQLVVAGPIGSVDITIFDDILRPRSK